MNAPQGRRLIALLKRRTWTSMQLLQTVVSGCWWKMVAETLRPDEHLVATKSTDGLNRYRVFSSSKWTV